MASGFRILAIVPVRSRRKNTSVKPAANHGPPSSLRAPPTRLYIKRGRPPPRPLATPRKLRVVSNPRRNPDYFTLSFEPSFILSRSNNGRHEGRLRLRHPCQGKTPTLSPPHHRNHILPNPLPPLCLGRTGGGRAVGRWVMDRPMRGGIFHIFFIVGVYFVPVKVWKRQGEERKEDVLHRAGASSLRFSLSGASARVLCLYWRLGSPCRSTLPEFEPYRTGTVFSSHLPPRRLFASSTRAYFAARSSRPSVRSLRYMRLCGRRDTAAQMRFWSRKRASPSRSGPVGTVRGPGASCSLSVPFGPV